MEGVGAPTVASMTEVDWPAVAEVYAAGIATGHSPFETATPDWDTFARGKHRHLCLVARDDGGRVLGCAWAAPISRRTAYAGAAEEAVYVPPSAARQGVGRALLEELVRRAEEAGIWTLQAGIFPENEASLRLHDALGFRVVGVRERIGLMTHGPMAGQWRDVVLLERRSSPSRAENQARTVGGPA